MLQDYLPPEVTGRLVPGLPPRSAASIELVPGLLDMPGLFVVPGLFEVPGLAKPVSGLPLPVTGRTAWLAPYQHTLAIDIIHIEAEQQLTYNYSSVQRAAMPKPGCSLTLPAALVIGLLKDVPGLAVWAVEFSSNSESAMPYRVVMRVFETHHAFVSYLTEVAATCTPPLRPLYRLSILATSEPEFSNARLPMFHCAVSI